MKSGIKHKCAALGAVVLLCAGVAKEAAATSYQVYAGPGTDYPVAGRVANAVNVAIYGCTASWDWCDVSYGPNRGWISASNLWGTYHHHRANIIEYGPQTDIPVIVFEQRSYWDSHYRSRPFYNQRTYWHGRDNDRDDRVNWDNDRDDRGNWRDRGWHRGHGNWND